MPIIEMTAFAYDLKKMFPTPALVKAAKKELARWGKKFKGEYDKTTATWVSRPQFATEIAVSDDEMSVQVSTTDNVYRFLHDGTKVRWAIMSSDFEPKTQPRILGSRPGRGTVVLRGKSVMKEPQPGIQARNWTQEIIKNEEKNFTKDMIKALNDAVAKGVT